MELVNGRQLDLFELMASIPVTPACKKVRAKVKAPLVTVEKPIIPEGVDETDYLSKGERIESLARDAFARALKEMTVSELEQKIFDKPYNTALNLFEHVFSIAKVIRAYLADVKDFSEDNEKMKVLRSLIDFKFILEACDFDTASFKCGAMQHLRYRGKKSGDQIRITIYEEGFPHLPVYCYRALNAGRKPLLFKDGSRSGDLATILAWLYVLTLYNRAIKDEGMCGPLAEEFRAQRPACDVPETYNELWSVMSSRHGCEARRLKGSDGELMSVKDSLTSALNKSKFRVPFMKCLRPRQIAIDEFCRLFDIEDTDIPASEIKPKLLRDRNSEMYRDSKGSLIYQWIIPYDVEYGIVWTDPMAYFKKGLGEVQYNRLLERAWHLDGNEPESVPLGWGVPTFGSVNAPYELLKSVLKVVWQEKGQLVRKYKYYRDMESGKSVAKSYQTKKGIPQKTMREMKESVFNEYFGYVEFDELCDLDKVRAVAEEFINFKEEVLPGFDSKNVALRFRRLGNHKALGLYYPMLGCLCVDINSPSSFVHEYGHCMDNVAADGRRALSDREEFYHTYSLYKAALEKAVREGDEATRDRLSGSSKYNLDYYLLHTEAFARCFELYVAEILKVDNSLCKPSEKMGFAYPKNEELLESIKGYFDGLLATINESIQENGLCA